MTKISKKSEATTNQTPIELDYSKMTLRYFCPVVSTNEHSKIGAAKLFPDDFPNIKTPTVEELAFLGKNNIKTVLSFLRHEEDEVRKQLRSTQKSLNYLESKTLEQIKSDHASGDGKIYCSWRGRGEDDGDSKKEFSCAFGKCIANWCYENPHPCDGRNCVYRHSQSVISPSEGGAFTLIGSISLSSDKERKCHWYDMCHTAEPRENCECVFNYMDSELLGMCKTYMTKQVNSWRAKLSFVTGYIRNVNKALKCSETPEHKPVFSLAPRDTLAGIKPGDKIVEILPLAKPEVRDGIVTGVNTSGRKSILYLELYSEEVDKTYLDLEVRTQFPCFLKQEDYHFLQNNLDYCKVWTRIIDPCGICGSIMYDELYRILARKKTLHHAVCGALGLM